MFSFSSALLSTFISSSTKVCLSLSCAKEKFETKAKQPSSNNRTIYFLPIFRFTFCPQNWVQIYTNKPRNIIISNKYKNLFYSIGCVGDRKSTRLNSSHVAISYAVLCLKK